MRTILLRNGLLALMIGLLLSCGGGASGDAGMARMSGFEPTVAGGAGSDGANAGGGSGMGGIGGIAADDGSTTTASGGGDDSSGVGSGGTGVSTADATGVGAVDGAGSIFVNGLRYDTKTAVGQLEDADNGIQLGMSVKVTGPVNADFTRGIARRVESAADLRGPVESVDAASGSFAILGTTVTTDEATVWADLPGPAALATGLTLQVWGLPAGPGVLRATRVEQRSPSAPILTGTVQNLDAVQRRFMLGRLVVDYAGAALGASPDGRALAEGTLVRVRGNAAGGRIVATQVQWWYPLPATEAGTAQFAGVVTDFAGLGSMRVLGFPVDASQALVTGGPAGSVGNGVKVQVAGVVIDGVLRASKLAIRNVPGAGGPASFRLIGNVGAFTSPSDFRVRGQPVNAAGPGVVFVNGGADRLGPGVRVDIRGAQVVDGVLMAQSVTFE